MPTKPDVLEALRRFQARLIDTASRVPADAWPRAAYPDGWTARDLLAHIASTSGVASFILVLSRAGGPTASGLPSRSGGVVDQDAWNQQQVDSRRERTVGLAVDEARSNIDRDLGLIEGASDEDLSRSFRAPWGIEGTVASVIIASIDGHLGVHLHDLQSALGQP